MKIGGFQKLTLLDYPGEVACIIFAAGCSLRCPYCHNSGLISPDAAGTEEKEITEYLKKRRGVLDGVVLTGGEPLMQKDAAEFMERIRGLGYKIKLDTNGMFPKRLGEVTEKGLADYIAMDVKHVPERYHAAAGVAVPPSVIAESAALLKSSGVKAEFRTTVVKGIHTADDITAIAEYLSTDIPYYLQTYKASAQVTAPEGLSSFSESEMRAMAEAAKKYCPNTDVRS